MKCCLMKSAGSALFFSLALIVAGALPVQAQNLKLYVPALLANDAAELGLTLVNPTSTEAEVTLTARTYGGAIIQSEQLANPVKLTIPASGQKSLRAAEIFGTGIFGWTGWVELSTSTPLVKGLFLVYDSGLSFLEGSELLTSPSSRLIFPKVSAGSSSPTRLNLINTAGQAVEATVSLYENSGQLAVSGDIALPAFSGFSGTFDQLVPSVSSFEGYVVVESRSSPSGILDSLIGLETYRNPSDIALIRAFSGSDLLRAGYLAHFATLAGYSTSLTLLNPSNQLQVLRITAEMPEDGRRRTPASVTVERALLPNARLEERIEQMFNLSGSALATGSIVFEIRGDTPGVIGFLNFGTADGAVLAAVEAQGRGYSDLVFSPFAEGSDYYTGLAFLNPNSEPTKVSLDTFDYTGNLTGSTEVILNPGERKAGLLGEFLKHATTQMSGYIRVSATAPIFALELLGSRGSSALLANVSAVDRSDSKPVAFSDKAENRAPSANAGTDQTITLPASANLTGGATDDGLPAGSRLTTTWSRVSGPGAVTFGNVNALSTTAGFSAAGTYVLRLTASDGALSRSADVTITVQPNPAPAVNAGPDQTITLPASANLNGTASDDRPLPAHCTNGHGRDAEHNKHCQRVLITTWSKVSGPGPVTFANMNALTTTARFTTAGTYVLRLTASNTALSSTDDITIVVNPAGVPPGLTDLAVHAAPATGVFSYSTFRPGAPGFPGLGQAYVDPVFGSTIRRVTNDYPNQSDSQIYSQNRWWNADSTRLVQSANPPRTWELVNPDTGAILRSDIPPGDVPTDSGFDPVNPSIWYYFSGASLKQFNIQTGVASTVKTFPGTLQNMGGSVDWVDRTGRYLVMSYNDAAHIWDKQTDTIYSGSVSITSLDAGWVGITPSGKYLVITGSQQQKFSYAIDHATHSLSSTGTMFWSLCGGHGDLVSPSDGKDYFFTFECDAVGGVFRVDITVPQSTSNRNKQRTDNVQLFPLAFADSDGHHSCASKAPNQDWCYVSTESADDTFSSPGTWRSGKQEIIMIQVVPPYGFRRLAHHRSRQVNCPTCTFGGYFHQPRLSTSWDGTKVAWASNFGYDASPSEYADIYVLNPSISTSSLSAVQVADNRLVHGSGQTARLPGVQLAVNGRDIQQALPPSFSLLSCGRSARPAINSSRRATVSLLAATACPRPPPVSPLANRSRAAGRSPWLVSWPRVLFTTGRQSHLTSSITRTEA